MNAQTESRLIDGPVAALELAIDRPDTPSIGVAVLAHPHPLHGGALNNKVVQTLARACVQAGWSAVRFNFRGIGRSGGRYDEGRGEREDFLAVVRALAPEGPLCLAGFSFGAFVVTHAMAELHASRDIRKAVLVGTAASRFNVAPIPEALHLQTLVIHGERDDTVPLADAMAWARPQQLPVLVIPDGGHFFHGQLPLLKGLVLRHLQA